MKIPEKHCHCHFTTFTAMRDAQDRYGHCVDCIQRLLRSEMTRHKSRRRPGHVRCSHATQLVCRDRKSRG